MSWKLGDDRRAGNTVLLSADRDSCYRARDAFFACVIKNWSFDAPNSKEWQHYTKKCPSERKEFEQLCPRAWVRHFDKLKERELQLQQLLKAGTVSK